MPLPLKKLIRTGLRRFGVTNFYASGLLPGEDLEGHMADLLLVADFRRDDVVLDMGCAEGAISMRVSKQVRHVLGVDSMEARIIKARADAKRLKFSHVSFEHGDAYTFPLSEYDVVLFLGVLGKRKAGVDALARLLPAKKRQIYIRVGIDGRKADAGIGLEHIFETLDKAGFDAVCLGRHELRRNLIVGNRRGTDATLKKLPPLLFVPATAMQDREAVAGVPIGEYSEFSL